MGLGETEKPYHHQSVLIGPAGGNRYFPPSGKFGSAALMSSDGADRIELPDGFLLGEGRIGIERSHPSMVALGDEAMGMDSLLDFGLL
ncbi:hypothetical protein HFN65_31315 [Rhizobium laguerreae]|nr:hypothetical protein [Rhizobium laguerreae]